MFINTKLRFLVPFILALCAGPSIWSQGTVVFQTLNSSSAIKAPVTFAQTRQRVGNGFFAQLYVGPEGTPVMQLQSYGPILAFIDGPRVGYISPGEQVALQGFPAATLATIQVRAFNGVSWEQSTIRGESNPLRIALGTIDGSPLYGLQPFTVYNISRTECGSLVRIRRSGIDSFGVEAEKKR
jgi:hypothetical protein